jgi:WD40 repeat protein
MLLRRFLPLLAALSPAAVGPVGAAPLPGEQLPPGVVARIGLPLLRHPNGVNCFAFSPDGKTLASATGEVRLWDVATGKELKRFSFPDPRPIINNLAFTPDGKMLAYGAQGEGIALLDAATGKEVRRLPGTGRKGVAPVFAFSADGKLLAWWGNDNVVHLEDFAAGKELRRWPGQRGQIPRFAFSGDGKVLAESSGLTITLHDTGSGQVLHRLTEERYAAYALALSPDGKTLATGESNDVRLWDVQTGKERGRGGAHPRPVLGLAFSPDGKLLLAACDAGQVSVLAADTGKELRKLGLLTRQEGGAANPVSHFAFSADGGRVAWVAWGERIHLTDLATGKELHPAGEEPLPTPSAFSPDGKVLAARCEDGRVRLWDAATGHRRAVLEAPDGGLSWLGFSPDGKSVIGLGTAVVFWDAQSGKETRRTAAPAERMLAAFALSPDGKTLALGQADLGRGGPRARDCAVILWDLEGGKERCRSTGTHAGGVRALAWRPDGSAVASAGADNGVLLWDATSGKELWRSAQEQAHESHLAFSADGKTLLSVGSFFDAQGGRALRLDAREASSGKPLRPVEVVAGVVQFQALSADGALLAWSDQAGAVLWGETATGKALGRLKGLPGPVRRVLFTPDGKRLATWSGDGSALVWDLGSPALKGRP